MREYQIALIIIFSIVTLGIVIKLVTKVKNGRHKKIVKKHSEMHKALVELNANAEFAVYGGSYRYHRRLNSKREFDRTTTDDVLKSEIAAAINDFRYLIAQIEFNITLNKRYCELYESLKSTVTREYIKKCRLKISYRRFRKIEKNLKMKNKLRPLTSVTVTCSYSYTSLKGRNRYKNIAVYDYPLLKQRFDEVENDIRLRNTREYIMKAERAKMTDAKRYSILKRDGFRCQICGLEQNDGVKLHVDHIFPVSKGGTSSVDNLRTLCERCNLGKSDDYT